jgi:cyclic pyranopterin phosphate synthase
MSQLIDSLGREITYFRVSITDRCNYRCIYCKPEKNFKFIPHQEILRYEEIVDIIQEAVNLGITKVRITGGEPLVRKGIVDFIKQLKKINKLKDISLTTNGFFLSDYAEELKGAGLNRVNISLDSLQENKYQMISQGGSLKKTLEGIDAALKAGLWPVKINIVLIKGINDDEVEDFVEFAIHKSPLHIRFIELMPSEEKIIDNYRDKLISVLEVKENLTKKYSLDPVKLNLSNGPAVYYQIGGSKSTIGFIPALSQHFCQNCNRIRLTSEGKLRPCLFSNKEINIKRAIRNKDNDPKIIRSKIIRNNLEEAISIKPKGHNLNGQFLNGPSFRMSRIGG